MWFVAAAAGVVPVSDDAEASLRQVLAAALEANRQLTALVSELREENARQAAELEKLRGEAAVFQRMLFGRSSEAWRSPGPATGGEAAGDQGDGTGEGGRGRRGPGARAGRRDYSHLPRVEVIWDFPDGTYCCAGCGEPYTLLGDHWSGEQVDWQVHVRVVAHCRRRYKRACSCAGSVTVMAPGPLKAIGKGTFTNGFIAMLLTERFVAGRSQNSLVAGLARQGAQVSAATLAGMCGQAGKLLVPLQEAIVARSRQSWHLHCDETTWRIFAPAHGRDDGRDAGAAGKGPATWWLWVFIGPDTVCFVMDATRAATVFEDHVGIDAATGQLIDGEVIDGEVIDGEVIDGAGATTPPRRLVISSDFYAVYSAAGAKADGLVNLYCWAHIRRHFVRAGDANPVQLRTWTANWLERIKDLYAAHRALTAAWQAADVAALHRSGTDPGTDPGGDPALQAGYAAWDRAIEAIDEARVRQLAAPGLCQAAAKAVATLNREWDGLIAHRDYPMIDLDNNVAERMIRGPVITRKNARGSHNGDTAKNAATIWTVTATAQMAGLNVLTYLMAYLDECGRGRGKAPTGADLDRFLPWMASPEDLRAWAKPPAPDRPG